MLISNIRLDHAKESSRLSAEVRFDTHWVWGDEPFNVWYDFPADYVEFLSPENGDAFVAAFLSSAMVLGEPLSISEDASVSPQLCSAVRKIQEIYRCWDPKLRLVPFEAQALARTNHLNSHHLGLFYSLGVDSSYSLAKRLMDVADRSELPILIMVEGFDVYLWESQRFTPMLEAATNIASELGTRVLSVRTNLREVSDRITDWVQHFHGAALASVVLALGSCFSNATIAASQTFRHLIPRGAHPLLDPLWNTETTRFDHDGLEASRLEKVHFISKVPLLIQHLRVCATSELTNAYNCGRCEKCFRTMIGLEIAGVLHSCETLPNEVSVEGIDAIELANPVAVANLEELVCHLGSSPNQQKIASAIRERIAVFYNRRLSHRD